MVTKALREQYQIMAGMLRQVKSMTCSSTKTVVMVKESCCEAAAIPILCPSSIGKGDSDKTHKQDSSVWAKGL